MNYKPLAPLNPSSFRDPDAIGLWLAQLTNVVPFIQTFEAVVNPSSVSATSESVQTITIAGVTIKDIIIVNKPTNTAGLDLIGAWASAADTVSVKFRNATGSPIDPAQETYRVMAIRL